MTLVTCDIVVKKRRGNEPISRLCAVAIVAGALQSASDGVMGSSSLLDRLPPRAAHDQSEQRDADDVHGAVTTTASDVAHVAQSTGTSPLFPWVDSDLVDLDGGAYLLSRTSSSSLLPPA